MDITKQLHEYEVEYYVLQEEMSTPRPELEELRKTKLENRKLTNQNLALIEQLDMMNKDISRLEKFRFNQQGTIGKLETKIRSLEITVKALGEFILDLNDEHKDIVVPGEIRRIISNLEHAIKPTKNEVSSKKPNEKSAFFKRIHSSTDFYERPHFSELCLPDDLPNGTRYGDQSKEEKCESGVIKGVPLKVIVDDDDEDRKMIIHQNPTNLTSKITSGVSSFFNSSHNQVIKNHNQKNKKTQENTGKANEPPGNNPKPKHIFSSEIGPLNIKESALHCSEKGDFVKTNVGEKSELNEPPEEAASSLEKTHFHPLDSCTDVNITYNGTTKLKSIKSSHKLIRNNTIDSIPVNNGFLHISEDEVFSKENSPQSNSKSVKPAFTEPI